MLKEDVNEARPIIWTTMDALLAWAPTRGRAGSDLRTAVGDIKANASVLLREDTIADPLINCFALANEAGIGLPEIEKVRRVAAEQTAVSVGAIVTKDTLIELALATMGYVIGRTTFISRQDVADAKVMVNAAFEDIEEEVADQMDSITYRAVIGLHAAIIAYLTETARPLPRMVSFRFNAVMSSLAMGCRLYGDAGRGDELRTENKVVHPAFMPRVGRALSS